MANVDKTGLGDRIVPLNQGERAAGYIDARKFTYADFSSSGDSIDLIELPANCFVARLWVVVKTAFNGTPVLIVGDSDASASVSDADGYLKSGEIEETSAIVSMADTSDGLGAYTIKGGKRPLYTTAGQHLRVGFSWSSTPTAGEAYLVAEIVGIPSAS